METLLLLAVFAVAAFTQGVTGFGSALVAVPLLCFFLDLKIVVPLSILHGLVITSFLSLRMLRHLETGKLVPLMIGCLPGIAVGTVGLRFFPVEYLKLLLGVLLLVYGLFHFKGLQKGGVLRSGWGYAAGFGTGLLGAALSTGGPPAVIYVTRAGWSKDSIKATLSGFFLFTGLVVAVSHYVGGVSTGTVYHLFLLTLPAVVIGVVAGAFCYDRLPQHIYLRSVHLLLIVMGLVLISAFIF